MNNLKEVLKFDEKGLIPVVTQDYKSKDVLRRRKIKLIFFRLNSCQKPFYTVNLMEL